MIEQIISLLSHIDVTNRNVGLEAQEVILGTLKFVRVQNTTLSPDVRLKLVKT